MKTEQAYNVLQKMGTLRAIEGGASLTINTIKRLTFDEAEMKSNDIEDLMLENGLNIRCAGATITDTTATFDLYPASS